MARYNACALALLAAGVPWLALATPTETDWKALNQSVHGRLFKGEPYARACFELAPDAEGSYDKEKCEKEIIPGYLDHHAIANTFGGYANSQFASCSATAEDCTLDMHNPSNPAAFLPPRKCTQGSVPRRAIKITNAQDAIEGYAFARKHKIGVVVKNTGHDWQGRNSGSDKLAFWTHHLKDITYHPEFLPTGCSDGEPIKAVTLGAGIQFTETLEWGEKNNITIPTGGDKTIGIVGGYSQGGGYSILSPSLGLAVDRVVEIEIVTPRGDHLRANRCQNTDIFFAVRGGSPSSFGVVISVTILALPPVKVACAIANFKGRTNSTVQNRAARFIAENANRWADLGWGYFAQPSYRMHFANSILPPDEAEQSMADLKEFVEKELDGDYTFSLHNGMNDTFHNCIEKVSVPTGTPFTTASRLIPRSILDDTYTREELITLMQKLSNITFIAFGTAPTNFTAPDPELTSITPAWREATFSFAFASHWNFDSSAEQIKDVLRFMGGVNERLAELTPGSGTYQNIAHVHEPNYQEAFWGPHYPKLLEIKKKYDPDHIMDCWQCVGWKGPNDPRYNCYPKMGTYAETVARTHDEL